MNNSLFDATRAPLLTTHHASPKQVLKRMHRNTQLNVPLDKDHYVVACSGGPDSVFAAHFIRDYLHKDVTLAHFNHGTEYCDDAEDFVRTVLNKEFDVSYSRITSTRPRGESPQEFWRRCRMGWLTTQFADSEVVLGHNLDDVAETWLFSSLQGVPKLIGSRYSNCIRPFMNMRKASMQEALDTSGIEYFKCPSNLDTKYPRNFIRHELMPLVEQLNQGGIYGMLRNKLLEVSRQSKTAAVQSLEEVC
jgi:tRNA(Ile)-lysidine synthase